MELRAFGYPALFAGRAMHDRATPLGRAVVDGDLSFLPCLSRRIAAATDLDTQAGAPRPAVDGATPGEAPLFPILAGRSGGFLTSESARDCPSPAVSIPSP